MKENLDASGRKIRCCFLNQNSEGKTMLNILNPDSAQCKEGVCGGVGRAIECIHLCCDRRVSVAMGYTPIVPDYRAL